MFKTFFFFYCFDLDLANWRKVEGLGRKQELYNAKKCFGFGNLSFIYPSGSTREHGPHGKRRTDEISVLCAGGCCQDVVGAYVRPGGYLSVVRSGSRNSQERRFCSPVSPEGDFTPTNGI